MGISAVLSPFMGIIEQVMDKVLPSDMDKAQAEKIKADAQAQFVKNALAEEGQFRNFMLEWEGRASDLHPAMAAFRASLRPVVSYAVYGAVIYLVITGQPIPQFMGYLAMMITIFWFGERSVKNVAPAIKDLLAGKNK